jgi:hypothetical protein
MHPPPMEMMNPETEFNMKEDYDLLENGYVLVSIGHWQTQELRLKRLGFKIPFWQTTMDRIFDAWTS